MLEQQVAMLQQQVRHHQEEVNSLRRQISQEYDVGYTHRRAKGFEEAMAMAIQAPHTAGKLTSVAIITTLTSPKPRNHERWTTGPGATRSQPNWHKPWER